MLDEMFLHSYHFLEIRKYVFFIVHFVLLYFPSNECPGLYWQLAKINNFCREKFTPLTFQSSSIWKYMLTYCVVSSNGNLFADSFWWKVISRIFFLHFYVDFRALCNSIQSCFKTTCMPNTTCTFYVLHRVNFEKCITFIGIIIDLMLFVYVVAFNFGK